MIKPVNDLFTKAVDYGNYRLAKRRARYDSSVASTTHLMQDKIDVRKKTHIITGQDPIAILGILARLKTACSHSIVKEGPAVWCCQYYLTGQDCTLLQSRLAGNTMAVDAGQVEMAETCPRVDNFLLRKYSTDETVAAVHNDVVTFQQGLNIPEE